MSNRITYLKKDFSSKRYAWRSQWISDFESPWSIIEKFKYMNSINSNDFLRYFGNDYIKKLRHITADIHKDLYELNNLNEDLIKDSLNYDLVKNNKNNIYLIIKSADKVNRDLLKEHLWYCPVCIKYGYHGILNQFKFIHKCPLHKIPLINKCPQCKEKIKYLLETKGQETAFTCKCSYNYLQTDSLIYAWKRYKTTDIKDINVKKWLALSEFSFEYYQFSNNTNKQHPYTIPQHLYTISDLLTIKEYYTTGICSNSIYIRYSNKNIPILKTAEQINLKRLKKTR